MSKRMPAAATDIAAVAEAAGQLGIETDNILKFTEVMIGLGEATNLTAEEGATQFARFANIVGMSQQDFDRLGSAVVALGNSFATTEAEIVAMGMRLAGQGAQIGMTEAQIMALAAAMSSVGIEAEAGGTAMSTTLKKIQVAVDEANDNLNKFAKVARMSADEFSKAFRSNPSVALQAFVDGLAESSKAGENLTLILNELGITGIRESDTLLRLAGANDVLRGALQTATQAWEENSALQNEVAQRYATTESQLAMFKNSLVDLGIQIGEIIVPALMQFVEGARSLVEWFAGLDESTQRIIVTIGGITAVLGPLLIIFGQVASAIGSIIALFGGMAASSTAAAAGTAAAGTAASGAAAGFSALLGPIGLAIAAVAGLTAGLTYLYNTNEEVRNALNAAWEFIKDAAESIFGALKEFWDKWGKDVAEFFKKTFGLIGEIFKSAFELIYEIAKKIFGNLKAFWDDWGESITIVFKTVWNTVKTLTEGAWNGIKITVETSLNVVRNIIKTITALIKGDWEGAWLAIKDIVTSIWNGITSFFNNAVGTMTEIGKNIIQGLINGIGSMAQAVWDKVKSIATGIWDTITGFFGINSPSRLMMEAGKFINEGLAIGLEDTTKKAVDAAKNVSSAVEDALKVNTASISVAVNETLGATSNPSSSVYNMEGLFNGATIVVRSDNDIRQLAQEIWSMTQRAQRGLGGARA